MTEPRDPNDPRDVIDLNLDLNMGDDGLPLGPEDRPRVKTSEQARVFLEGNEATAFRAEWLQQRRDIRQILTTLRQAVSPRLKALEDAVSAADQRAERQAAVAHNRIDHVEKQVEVVQSRIGNVEGREIAAATRHTKPAYIFIGTVLAFALGGAIARTYDALLLPHLSIDHRAGNLEH